jgi:Tol biopolymer transport system component
MRRDLALAAAVAALLATTPAAQSDNARQLLETARKIEQVDGDLPKAMAKYHAIAEQFQTRDRAVAAEALLRLAACYERTGDDRAAGIYQRIVRDFADQAPAASARAKAGSRASVDARAVTIRQIGEGEPWSGVSYDGRFVTTTDWSTGDLMLVDTEAGTRRRLTNFGKPFADYAEEALFSPDGRRVVFSWLNDVPGSNIWAEDGSFYDLRMISTEDRTPSPGRVLIRRPHIAWIAAYDWARDTDRITVAITPKDRTTQIGVYSLAGGQLTVLETLPEWRGLGKVLFSPDGRFVVYDAPSDNVSNNYDIYVLAADGSGKQAVVAHPSHDVLVGWTPDGANLLFVSDRTDSFGIYSLAIKDGRAVGGPRLVRGAVGPITPLRLTNKGSLFYAVPTGGVADVHLAKVDWADGRLAGTPQAIPERMGSNNTALYSPDGQRLAYVSAEPGRPRMLVIRDVVQGRTIRESRVDRGWPVRWSPDGRQLLVRATSRGGVQSLVAIDTRTDERLEIQGTGSGIWSADSARLFLNLRDREEHVIAEHDLKTGLRREILRAATPVGAFHVTADGKLYYRRSVGENAAFVERAIDSGHERTITEGRGVGLNLSPDGKWIATASAGRQGGPRRLQVIEVATGASRTLLEDASAAGLTFAAWAPGSTAVIARKVYRQTEAERAARLARRAADPTVEPGASQLELWWLPVDGRAPQQLHHYPVTADSGEHVSVSPDGSIAFTVSPADRRRWEIAAIDNLVRAAVASQR